jgi:hypothetical protein
VQSELEALSVKERLFVEAYLGEAKGVAAKAARLAGYKHPGVIGCRLLKKVHVQTAIKVRLEPLVLTVDQIIARLCAIATGHVGELVTVDRKGRWRVDAGKVQRSGIAKRMRETRHGPDVEVCDQLRALELLGRYHGMWKGPAANETDLIEAIREAERIHREKYGPLPGDELEATQPWQLPGPVDGDA